MSQICVKDESSVNFNNNNDNHTNNNISKKSSDDNQVTLNRQKYRIDIDQLHYTDQVEKAQGSIADVRRFIEAHQQTENYPTKIKVSTLSKILNNQLEIFQNHEAKLNLVSRLNVAIL